MATEGRRRIAVHSQEVQGANLPDGYNEPKNTENVFEELDGLSAVEVAQVQQLIYWQNQSGSVLGMWFYDQDELLRIAGSMEQFTSEGTVNPEDVGEEMAPASATPASPTGSNLINALASGQMHQEAGEAEPLSRAAFAQALLQAVQDEAVIEQAYKAYTAHQGRLRAEQAATAETGVEAAKAWLEVGGAAERERWRQQEAAGEALAAEAARQEEEGLSAMGVKRRKEEERVQAIVAAADAAGQRAEEQRMVAEAMRLEMQEQAQVAAEAAVAVAPAQAEAARLALEQRKENEVEKRRNEEERVAAIMGLGMGPAPPSGTKDAMNAFDALGPPVPPRFASERPLPDLCCMLQWRGSCRLLIDRLVAPPAHLTRWVRRVRTPSRASGGTDGGYLPPFGSGRPARARGNAFCRYTPVRYKPVRCPRCSQP